MLEVSVHNCAPACTQTMRVLAPSSSTSVAFLTYLTLHTERSGADEGYEDVAPAVPAGARDGVLAVRLGAIYEKCLCMTVHRHAPRPCLCSLLPSIFHLTNLMLALTLDPCTQSSLVRTKTWRQQYQQVQRVHACGGFLRMRLGHV